MTMQEAFTQFEQWKILKTPLRITVMEPGQPTQVLMCRVYGHDEDIWTVGVVGQEAHSYQNFDVADAVFSRDSSKLVATRGVGSWLVFDESLS